MALVPTIAPLATVTGAVRVPLPFGLLSVLTPREGSTDRWVNGVQWETLTCEPVGGIGAPACPPFDDEGDPATLGLPKSLDANRGDVGEASPFTVYGHHNCSPIGTSFDQAADYAVQHLLTREEARVEQALWTGDLGNVPNFAGANGYDTLEDLGDFDDAWLAVSALEQAIAVGYGSLGLLHMSREAASRLMKYGALRVNGARIFTALGTPVVAGTGYDSDKIVATAPLFGYRGDIFTSSDTPGDLLDRRNNNLYAIAERTYVLGFDPCGAASATLTAPEGGA